MVSLSKGFEGEGIGDDAGFAAAEGHADEGALPGHFHGQAGDVVEGDGGGHADAALGGSEGLAVAYDEGADGADGAILELRREVHFDAFFGDAEHGEEIGAELAVKQCRGAVEVGQCVGEDGGLSLCHGVLL